MSPEPNPVCRFVAEPPQEPLPEGRWDATLTRHFLGACDALDEEEDDLGEPGDVSFFPDRTWHGRTYIPATTLTSTGYELFGYVSFRPGGEELSLKGLLPRQSTLGRLGGEAADRHGAEA